MALFFKLNLIKDVDQGHQASPSVSVEISNLQCKTSLPKEKRAKLRKFYGAKKVAKTQMHTHKIPCRADTF